jgi:hypothetical protein
MSVLARGPGRVGLVALSLAGVAIAYAATCFVHLFVYSPGDWFAGVLVGSVARAIDGGNYYEGAGSLLGPTWPYFPFCVLVTHGLARVGVPLLLLPPLLGGLSAFLLPVASAAFARSLQARWVPSLIVAFVLYGLLLPHYRAIHQVTAGFSPDACVPLFLTLACATLSQIERSGLTRARLAGFGLCLLAAGLSKQAGGAGIAGSVAYLVLFSRMEKAARWKALAIAVTAGLAVVVVVLATPHCFEVTVRVMSHHPKHWERLAVVWEHLFTNQLPAVLLYLLACTVALTAGAAVRRQAAHLTCVLTLVLVVQVLSSVKDGGGGEHDSYNMDMVVSLALPLAVWAWGSRLGNVRSGGQVAVIAVACAFCTKALEDGRRIIWAGRTDSWISPHGSAKDFAALNKRGPVFATADSYWSLYTAGYRIATTPPAIWHFAVVDPQVTDATWLQGVERAIRERRYTLISPRWSESLPEGVRNRLSADITANYAPTSGTPWWAPRR